MTVSLSINCERKMLIVGATGYAGSACADTFHKLGWDVDGFSRVGGETPGGLQILAGDETNTFSALLKKLSPDVVIVAAGIPDLDLCECAPQLSQRSNVLLLSEWIADIRIICPSSLVVLLSSIYVFGEYCPSEGFCETDVPYPVSVYGHHKLQAEQLLQASGLRHLIVRLPWLIGNVMHTSDPIRQICVRLMKGQAMVDEGLRFPTDVKWVGESIALLVSAGTEGIVHLSAANSGSRFDLIESLLSRCLPMLQNNLQSDQLSPKPPPALRAPRPKFLKLYSTRSEVQNLQACSPWQHIIERYAVRFMQEFKSETGDC